MHRDPQAGSRGASPSRAASPGWLSEAVARGGAAAWSLDLVTSAFELSPGGEALLGATPSSPDQLERLIHPDDRPARQLALRRALARGERWVSTFRLLGLPDTAWIEERGAASLDPAGRPARALALLIDVTARCETEEVLERRLRAESSERHAAEAATGTAEAAVSALVRSEAFLESMFSSIADGIILCDREGRITRVNPAAREMLRYGEELTAATMDDRLAQVTIRDVEGRVVTRDRLPLAAALRGESVKGVPLAFQFPDGRQLWVTVGAAPIREPGGGVVGAVLSLGDVSRLRDLQEQREDLSRMLAHDLRTPLGVILAQAKLIGRRAEAAEAVRGRADAIVSSAQAMASMLNDLVESALLEAGKLRLEQAPVNLPEMVRDLRRRLAATFDGERIRLVGEDGVPRVMADPNRIERVLVNLLTNALKYSAPGTEVVVRFATVEDDVLVEVEDRGQGIAPEDVPHLFERYFRAAPSFRFEGMGLGLYTARMLVEAHGGAITVRSVPGQGSTFQLRLPGRPSREPPLAGTAGPA